MEAPLDALVLLDVDKKLFYALADVNYQKWELPRPEKCATNRGYMRRARSGSRVDGALSSSIPCPPPAMCLCSPGEVPGTLGVPHQVGHPPTVHLDA